MKWDIRILEEGARIFDDVHKEVGIVFKGNNKETRYAFFPNIPHVCEQLENNENVWREIKPIIEKDTKWIVKHDGL